MSVVTDRPHVIDEGVCFTVTVGFMKRECLIPRQTLSYISRSLESDEDYMSAFRAHEDTIMSVARRMIVAGAGGSPVVLERRYFH